jgi:adenylate cyclase
VPRSPNFQDLGDLILRGRSDPLRAYEPLPADAFRAPAMMQYSQAFAKLEAGGASAMPHSPLLSGRTPTNPLAGFHVKRLLNGAKGVRR